MITVRGWGTRHLRHHHPGHHHHHNQHRVMGGTDHQRRFHLVRDDFRRRMMAFLRLDGRGGAGSVPCARESRAFLFKYSRRKRSENGVKGRGGVVGTGEVENGRVEGGKGTGVSEVVGVGGDDGVKACLDCQTTRTPLWRSGPSGSKTLCNACGIRYRKQRRKSLAGSSPNNNSSSRNGNSSEGSNRRSPSPAQVMDSELLKQRQRRKQEGLWLLLQQSRKFATTCGKEEAEAAVLLMALSTGLFVHS